MGRVLARFVMCFLSPYAPAAAAEIFQYIHTIKCPPNMEITPSVFLFFTNLFISFF
jgi:hypothetical protein